MVGMEGVEPPHLSALGSKPSVSTSSTTSPERKRIILQNEEILISFVESKNARNMEFHFFFFDAPKSEQLLKKPLQRKQKDRKN